MDETLYKLLSVLAKEYHLQAASSKCYPCHYAILGDDGPWYAKTPRDVLLNCIVQFYRLRDYHSKELLTEESEQALGELVDLAFLVQSNNIDVSVEFTNMEEFEGTHYEINIWHTFHRYAQWILEKTNKPVLNVGVDDLIDFIWDFETTNVEHPNP